MTDLRIIPVMTAHEEALFFALPQQIYAEAPLWVPPLLSEEKKLLNVKKHPFWQKATRQLFLALRGAKPVGRIVALVDAAYNSHAQERCGAWGFFECYNDEEAAHGLFDAAALWLKEQGMGFMRGPLNPSTNYTCGMLVGGFELAPCIMMPWNFSYYPALVESWAMRKEQDLFAYEMRKDALRLPDWVSEQLQSIEERKEFTWRCASKATMTQDIHTMLDIFKESWAKNWGFSPMSLAEAENHVHGLKSVLDPDFFVLFYHGDTPAGGMLALPDMNPLLKRLNGRLGLLTPWHWWQSRKEIQGTYRMVLFGIKEEYRMLGLPLLLFNYMVEQGRKMPHFSSVEGSWTLESNGMINDLMEDFGGVMTKRYRIYRRELADICPQPV